MNDTYPDWFLWAYQKGFVFWIATAGVFGALLLGVVLHLDDSVRDAEERLHQDLVEMGDELQDEEGKQSSELQQIRKELDEIRIELKQLREGKK